MSPKLLYLLIFSVSIHGYDDSNEGISEKLGSQRVYIFLYIRKSLMSVNPIILLHVFNYFAQVHPNLVI